MPEPEAVVRHVLDEQERAVGALHEQRARSPAARWRPAAARIAVSPTWLPTWTPSPAAAARRATATAGANPPHFETRTLISVSGAGRDERLDVGERDGGLVRHQWRAGSRRGVAPAPPGSPVGSVARRWRRRTRASWISARRASGGVHAPFASARIVASGPSASRTARTRPTSSPTPTLTLTCRRPASRAQRAWRAAPAGDSALIMPPYTTRGRQGGGSTAADACWRRSAQSRIASSSAAPRGVVAPGQRPLGGQELAPVSRDRPARGAPEARPRTPGPEHVREMRPRRPRGLAGHVGPGAASPKPSTPSASARGRRPSRSTSGRPGCGGRPSGTGCAARRRSRSRAACRPLGRRRRERILAEVPAQEHVVPQGELGDGEAGPRPTGRSSSRRPRDPRAPPRRAGRPPRRAQSTSGARPGRARGGVARKAAIRPAARASM